MSSTDQLDWFYKCFPRKGWSLHPKHEIKPEIKKQDIEGGHPNAPHRKEKI